MSSSEETGKVLLLVKEFLWVTQTLLTLDHVPHLPSLKGGGHEHYQPRIVLDDAAYAAQP